MRFEVDNDGNITEHEDAPIIELTEEEILQQKISEADAYLKSTDWIEPYIIKHELKIELIADNSSKWEIINKRAEYKAFLKVNKKS